ncbi:transcriptional regulator [Brevundimonas intermedia]|uniref:Transcriptional regulator n=1 Tax=Brevundimonas intermedia TaxID=74315 RepID=A0ABQ5T4F6_9CAUL|nr:FecR domain-containing protein [Brevundimonas intermedia]GLK47644.1 transcriptional regulator [Brevundimonas intermedia]
MTQDAVIKDEEIAAQAAAWVVRLRADDVTVEDLDAAAAWLSADLAHRRAFDEAEGLWAATDHLVHAQASPVVDLAAHRERRKGIDRRWMVAAPAMAAALAAAVFLAPLLQSAPTVVYQTAPGETRTVALEDGSRLQINGGSTLSVKMELGRRLVHMDQAEAVFDVAHDAGRPFLIDVGESQVRVVGTAFNIRRSAQETEVSVLRGVVEVGDLDRSGRKVRLTVGQAVRRADADDRMTVAPVDVRTAAAWTRGRRAYDDKPLSEIAADLSRAFATPVTVAPDAANLRFSGVLVLDDETAVIGRLERFLPIKATRGPQGVRLERR